MGARGNCTAAGRRFLNFFAEMARIHADDVLFKWFPKFHLFQHLVEFQLGHMGNPKLAWCYTDESNIGKAADIAEACHPSTVHRLVLQKARL